jgi:group I intron endonuclease
MADDIIETPVFVYKITCTVNGKAYIGITKGSVDKRWKSHVNASKRKNTKNKKLFQHAIAKHGADKFKIEVIYEAVNNEEAAVVERAVIAAHNTFVPLGYNLSTGGEFRKFVKRSKISRQKLSAAKTGVKLSDETRRNMSASKKGVPWTDAQRESITATQQTPEYREKMRAANAKRGKQIYTDETRKSISESVKAYHNLPGVKEKQSASAKKRLENPELREKISQGLKEYNAAKRAEKALDLIRQGYVL